MIELRPGDLILVRGRSLRYKIARFILRVRWNHAAIYHKDDVTQELNWSGTERKLFEKDYAGRQIVVLRLQHIDALTDMYRRDVFVFTLNELQNCRFSWIKYLLRVLRIEKRNSCDNCDGYLCDEYINQVYYSASKRFAAGDFRLKTDCIDLMRRDYSDRDLLIKHNLVKVWDYRWIS